MKMKITKITKLQPGVYAHVCPICGSIHASASEAMYMPEFSICACDRNGNRQEVYEVFDRDGEKWIRRNKYPRFIGRITFGALSDIEDVNFLDECENVMELASAMRKAGEFLIKVSRNA